MKYQIKLKLNLKTKRKDKLYHYSQDLESKAFDFPNPINEGESIHFPGCPRSCLSVDNVIHMTKLDYTVLYLTYEDEYPDYSDQDFDEKIIAPYREFLDKIGK